MALRLPILFVLFWNCPLTAQYSIFYTFVTSEARGTGKTGICSFLGESSILNPSGYSKNKHTLFELETHNYFLVKELYSGFVSYQKPLKNSGFGLSLALDGSPEFNDFSFVGSYGRKLSQKTHLGVSVYYIHGFRAFSPESNHLEFSVGFQTYLGSTVLLGFVFQNPILLDEEFQRFNKSIYKLGLSYLINKFTEMNLECHLNNITAQSVHVGFRYDLHSKLSLLCGFQMNPAIYSFGLIAKLNNRIKITSSFENHLLLGWSPSLGLKFYLE